MAVTHYQHFINKNGNVAFAGRESKHDVCKWDLALFVYVYLHGNLNL